MRDQAPPRRPTATSAFGVSRRESHDASAFYERFTPPIVSTDSDVSGRRDIDEVFVGDSRNMDKVDDASVALVVTSPPYFAGKEYETSLGEGHVPASYSAYLRMLEEVFAECVRTLEPGGRIAVNVANLGRRPYRSLSADVTAVLQDRLRLLLRGEVIWVKARGAGGSCAWGSFQSPANPVLRDLTERVIIASKGRFDRAIPPRQRAVAGLPSEISLFRDEFMEATTDIWEIPPESARRVGHPAPFPVELPERLIHLYTFRDDLVLDPFMGVGTTGVAAVRSERHYVGYDTDPAYVEAAKARIDAEGHRVSRLPGMAEHPPRAAVGALRDAARRAEAPRDDSPARGLQAGLAARDLGRQALEQGGFTDVEADVSLPCGVDVSFRANDRSGVSWHVEVGGGFTSNRPGLRRPDLLWKVLGKAAVLHEVCPHVPLLVLTSGIPARRSTGARALDAVCGRGRPIREVLLLQGPDTAGRIAALAAGDAAAPAAGDAAGRRDVLGPLSAPG